MSEKNNHWYLQQRVCVLQVPPSYSMSCFVVGYSLFLIGLQHLRLLL